MGGRIKQAVLITRSQATQTCEPCQSLTTAALSRTLRVPWGSFVGAGYLVSTPVRYNKECA